jgi:hypothetical protein
MTGAYEFKRHPWDDGVQWDKIPKGHWSGKTANGLIVVSCPVCGGIAGLPHKVDAAGNVTPSLVCPFPPCPMHLAPVKLLDWNLGERKGYP